MSTDYHFACFTCKEHGPVFASSSISYGYKVWIGEKDWLEWLGHRQDVGKHEGHDLRIVHPDAVLPWDTTESHEIKYDEEPQ